MPEPLFPALIGPTDWPLLAEPVQRMHGGTVSLSAHGVAQVDGARHPFARLLRRVLGLPEPGADQAIALSIERSEGSETWTRSFANGRMRSTLERAADGIHLRERLGPVSLYFALRRDGDAIDWQLQQGRLLGLPLPRAMFGSVFSHSLAEDGRYVFHIDTRLPLLGQLIAYRGWLDID
ncbi:DUF4166 domain-containing protein [Dyella sp. LX-66]|uniref:DUF4166 domain-containing protein n=1 Tax=unclassified Dyella TaxID=2634549 RepID=UPI001BE03637|nr:MULTISPECIES: DUF4166 domain-containing protein [unclassified Dyella]MBT2119406.1 DUF4166 domain-containing protein [Dyella sp. LX-1]MBT2138625.1 DUF4166 domain-containing protein [Dyella sp. LX-66]